MRGKKPSEVTPKKAKILIYGKAGVGKTWATQSFPDCYFLDCEGGATRKEYVARLEEAGALYMGPEEGASDFKTVLSEVQFLARDPGDRRTLVIDSYSKLWMNEIAAEEERLQKSGEKIAFGNQKMPAVKLSRRLATWLDKLDMNVVLVCHERALWEGNEQVGHTFDGWEKLDYLLDLTIRVVKRGGVRKGIVAKSRLSGFADGSSFDWSYDEFAERYGREIIEGEVVPLEPASKDQVLDLKHLLERVRIDNATTIKWKEKAGVDSWDEMDSATIQKCIEFLRKKAA